MTPAATTDAVAAARVAAAMVASREAAVAAMVAAAMAAEVAAMAARLAAAVVAAGIFGAAAVGMAATAATVSAGAAALLVAWQGSRVSTTDCWLGVRKRAWHARACERPKCRPCGRLFLQLDLHEKVHVESQPLRRLVPARHAVPLREQQLLRRHRERNVLLERKLCRS